MEWWTNRIFQALIVGLRAADDVWVLGDEVEQSVPVDLEFTPWHEDRGDNLYTGNERGYHGWADGL
jgi:hypothetical protein